MSIDIIFIIDRIMLRKYKFLNFGMHKHQKEYSFVPHKHVNKLIKEDKFETNIDKMVFFNNNLNKIDNNSAKGLEFSLSIINECSKNGYERLRKITLSSFGININSCYKATKFAPHINYEFLG